MDKFELFKLINSFLRDDISLEFVDYDALMNLVDEIDKGYNKK